MNNSSGGAAEILNIGGGRNNVRGIELNIPKILQNAIERTTGETLTYIPRGNLSIHDYQEASDIRNYQEKSRGGGNMDCALKALEDALRMSQDPEIMSSEWTTKKTYESLRIIGSIALHMCDQTDETIKTEVANLLLNAYLTSGEIKEDLIEGMLGHLLTYLDPEDQLLCQNRLEARSQDSIEQEREEYKQRIERGEVEDEEFINGRTAEEHPIVQETRTQIEQNAPKYPDEIIVAVMNQYAFNSYEEAERFIDTEGGPDEALRQEDISGDEDLARQLEGEG